ncbi:MAG: multidrug efflux system outer membrane protein [Myxococcota bacterium]|jgi:multidrug efflux system outer membrane protein
MSLLRKCSVIWAAALLLGTAQARDRAEEVLPDLGERFSEGSDDSVRSAAWWVELDSAELSRLMDAAIDANPDLLTAISQARQAHALSMTAVTGFAPSVSLGAQVSMLPSESLLFGNPAASGNSFADSLTPLYEALAEMGITVDTTETETETATFADTVYTGSASATVSLPVDLWGVGVQSFVAGRWDARASAAAAESLRLTVTTSVARAWLDVVTGTARVVVVEEQIQTASSILELTELRYDRGEATVLDVLQQRQQLATTRGLLPQSRALLRLSKQQLSILLGQSASQSIEVLTTELPVLPAQPPVGTPSDLVSRSPTVLVAAAQLTAAHHREQAAWRASLPSLALQASYGPQFYNFDGESWDSDSFWSAGASVSMPIFQSGAALNGIRSTRSGADAAGYSLQSAALSAVQQVEAALVLESERTLQQEQSQLVSEAAAALLDAALEQYRSGLINHIPVIAAQQSSLSAELSLLQADRDLLDARIQLHAALGSAATSAGDAR